MLSARLDGETILLHEPAWNDREAYLRAASRAMRLTAPCCGAPLVLKWGVRKVRHFAHAARVSCPYQKWSEPESPEHAAGKVLLYDWCRRFFGDAAVVQLERPLPQTLQRPDVYMELPDGRRFALEYQRSAISLKEWQERHEAYRSTGITDIWILGENRLQDALPTPEQQARWAEREPHMLFLDLRAFENAAAVQTPFEVAWWRGEQQEELWFDLKMDAGRELTPWFERAALSRLRSLTFLDATTGELVLYRAMRELRGHVDTRMASVCLRLPLATPGLELAEYGFVTPADRERLTRHEERVSAFRVQEEQAPYEPETPPQRPEVVVRPLPPDWPDYFHREAERRWRLLRATAADPALFLLTEQEEEQRRRLQERAEVPEWRKIVDRFGLNPENLFFLVGVPIPDDTVIQVHRTVWQAFIYYRLVYGRSSGGLTARGVCRLLARLFRLDEEMVRVATHILPGRVLTPDEVVGTYLNLLVDTGYLRNDLRLHLLRYHRIAEAPPPLAFADRRERREAWAGLLERSVRLEEGALVGGGMQVKLVPAAVGDRPTPARAEAVARLARRRHLQIDLENLRGSEASRPLRESRRKPVR